MRKYIGYRAERVSASLVLALCLLCAFAAQARPIEALDYQKRFDDSALVVIATPTAKTLDTKENSQVLKLYRQDLDGKQVPIDSIGVETPFAVSLTLKGDKDIKQFTLHHYRLSDEVPLSNGPMLFTVGDVDSPSVIASQKPRSSYLLFLTREPDGRYAPTGGQLDPAYEAIFPLPFEQK